jgi:predicted nuclease with TOPRIM domain
MAKPARVERPREQSAEGSGELSQAISALETAITALRERAEAAERRADASEAEKADLRNQRDRAQAEVDRLTQRIAELEAQLAKQSEPPASEDMDAISADLEHERPPSPAWLEEPWGLDASDDQSTTADPAHQVERLWQRIEELEHRLEAAKAERAGGQSEMAVDQAPATTEAKGDAMPESSTERPRRWWRRVLWRRRA